MGYKFVSMEDCDIFISVMYDQLVTDEFIKSKKACFNFHPGVLPWYRGAGAYSWALINGEMETGVTLHKIDKDIDHGDVISIRRFPIHENDTAETLFKKAEQIMFEMFQDRLGSLATSNPISVHQAEGKIYYRKDLEKAKNLTRMIRAFTFTGKEDAYYFDAKGKKIYLKYHG